MFLIVISLFVGFLCLMTVVFMIFNKVNNHKTNIYFIIILFVVGIQRFTYAIEYLGIVKNTYSPLKLKLSLGLFLVPIYYLFFRRLVQGSGEFKKEFVHFIPPSVVILLNIFFNENQINFYYFVFYSTFYLVLLLLLLDKFRKRKNTSMLQILNDQHIKKWLLLMISLTFLLFIFANYFVFNSSVGLGNFYKYSSLLWLLVLIYMFKNPIVIFGDHYLLKNSQLKEPREFLIWSRKILKPIEDKDKIVYNTTLKKIDFIISNIQTLQKSVPMLSQSALTAETLSKKLQVPRRHIEFVFKYYCRYSISDFSNLVKVCYALSLINEGFLDHFTVASLGEKCLFNSRFTFSTNFKKFVGISVSDYINSDFNTKFLF